MAAQASAGIPRGFWVTTDDYVLIPDGPISYAIDDIEEWPPKIIAYELTGKRRHLETINTGRYQPAPNGHRAAPDGCFRLLPQPTKKQKTTRRKCSESSAPLPKANAPPAAAPPASAKPIHTHDEVQSFMLESFDSLIAPQIIHSANFTPSQVAVRRNLSRPLFSYQTTQLLQSSTQSFAVDDLVAIINSACIKCGLVLA